LPTVLSNLVDISKLVPHRQNQYIDISNFQLAFGLLAHIFGINRTLYAALREVMGLLRQPDDKPLADIHNLPNQLATLKSKIARRFPMMDMRTAEVPLIPEKLATEKATRKTRGGESGPIMAELHIIDPASLFSAFLSSDIGERMHSGMAHFVDEPTELFHSHSWASSIRTTSGEFAHVLNAHGYELETVFPSDFVLYCCTNENCVCQTTDAETLGMTHAGRVYSVGKDHRTEYCTAEPGEVALQIQEAFGPSINRPDTMTPSHPFLEDIVASDDQAENELILASTASIVYIPQTHLIKRITHNVACDHFWGETMDDPSASSNLKGRGKQKDDFPKYEHRAGPVEQKPFIVRRVIFEDGLVPLCHTHPLRAELELNTYGRAMFDAWDDPDRRVRSCPILLFIDGFGIYRNSYRSLVGVYAIAAGLEGDDRHRPANIFPLTLSPHGSNFDDTVRALQSLGQLDHGIETTINGEKVLMCVPTLCYIGDMPQQDKNSGFRGPRAKKFCRFCLIGQKAVESGRPNDVLDFDIVTHGRYHFQTVEMRKELNSKPTNAKTNAYAAQWGLGTTNPALADISPALDLIMSRPPDPAHSEYQGITELMHTLLLGGILSEAGKEAYARNLRTWPFPPGWGRLQSPLHHLKSYSLASHARWSVIVPTLLRSWLRPRHIHKIFLAEGKKQLGTENDVVEFIVRSFARLAKSNSVLMGLKVSADDRMNLGEIVRAARLAYQQLCQFTSQSIIANPRAYSRFPSRVPTAGSGGGRRSESAQPDPHAMPPPPPRFRPGAATADTPIVSVEGQGIIATPKRAAQFIHDMTRPNVHLGIHYPLVAHEYGLPVNVNTLLGENQHR
jgi:hypothetical protein